MGSLLCPGFHSNSWFGFSQIFTQLFTSRGFGYQLLELLYCSPQASGPYGDWSDSKPPQWRQAPGQTESSHIQIQGGMVQWRNSKTGSAGFGESHGQGGGGWGRLSQVCFMLHKLENIIEPISLTSMMWQRRTIMKPKIILIEQISLIIKKINVK